MTSIDTSALTAHAVWNRFVASADTNGDGSLDGDELAALDPNSDIAEIVAERDSNGDGVLSPDEKPRGAFSPMLFEQLLSAQEYRDASPEQRRTDDAAAIAEMFARADVDGDGVLSAEEWEAERTLNKSRFIDSGELPDVAFIARRGRDDGSAEAGEGLRPEDFLVGRKVELETVPASELPDDWSERFAELRRASDGLPPDQQPKVQKLDPETVRADMIAEIEAMPMSAAFMTRLLMALSEGVTTETTA